MRRFTKWGSFAVTILVLAIGAETLGMEPRDLPAAVIILIFLGTYIPIFLMFYLVEITIEKHNKRR